MNMNKIEFVDIVSKPVGITYSRIQTLGIYCWQYERTERRAAFFLPRLSFNSNNEYLENLYPGISKKDLQGKGIYTSIWKIAKFYNKVSILNPEEILYNDFAPLSAFKCWVERDSDLKRKKEKGEEVFLQIYVLENESRFPKFKYTEVQNSAATIYYDWSEIPEESEEIKSK